MQTLPVAAPSQKSRKGTLIFSLDSNEYATLQGAAHGHSTNLRDTAEYTEAVLGVKSGVPTQPLHVLSTVYACATVFTFLDDKKLFLLKVIEQANIVSRHEKLRVARIGLLRLEIVKKLADDIHVKVVVNLVNDGGEAQFQRNEQLKPQVEQALGPAGLMA